MHGRPLWQTGPGCSAVLVCALLVSAGARGRAETPLRPILWFDFATQTDEVCTDRGGSGNDGRLYGPKRVETPLGPGLEFDGKDDFIALPDIDFHSFKGLTVEAWVKPEGVGRQPILGFGVDTVNLNADGRKAQFIVRNVDADRPTAADADPLVPGEFHHLVGTYDKQATRIYVDGKLKGVAAHSGDIRDDRYIGTRIGSGLGYPSEQWDYYFRGTLAEIKVYDAALSAEEIKATYKAMRAKHPEAVAAPYLAPPVLHFDFEGSDAVVCVDRSPKGKNGRIHGALRIEFAGGHALEFDGVDDCVLPRPIGFGGFSGVTIEALVRLDDHRERQPILNFGVDTVHLHCDEGKPGFRVRPDPGDFWREAVARDRLPVGEWHHLCGVYEGNELRLYVDGELQSAKALTGPIRDDAYLGSRIACGLRYPEHTWDLFFHGALADVRVYDRALSAEQIRERCGTRGAGP